jgi:SNF family Na+-dependent transporter
MSANELVQAVVTICNIPLIHFILLATAVVVAIPAVIYAATLLVVVFAALTTGVGMVVFWTSDTLREWKFSRARRDKLKSK